MVLTAVCDLAGVSTGAFIAKLWKSGADFAKTFICGAVSWALVLC